MRCCSQQLLPGIAASTLLRLLKPCLMQIFPHRDVDMWGHVWMSCFRGAWQNLNFDKEYLFGFRDFCLCNFRDLIYTQPACNTTKRKQNLKSHHMTPLKTKNETNETKQNHPHHNKRIKKSKYKINKQNQTTFNQRNKNKHKMEIKTIQKKKKKKK